MKNYKAAKFSDVCFYIFWILLLIGKGLGFTSIDAIFRNITFIAVLFAAAKISLSKWRTKELVFCICFNVLGLLILIFSGDSTIFLTTIAITACKDIDIYRLLKVTFWLKLLLFFTVTSLAIAGVTDKQQILRYNSPGNYDIRYALGYGHPNSTQYTLFIILALMLIVYHQRMRLFHYIVALAYSLFIFRYTGSRSGILMTCAMLALVYFFEKRWTRRLFNAVEHISKYVYVLCAALSFAICFMFAKIEFLHTLGTLSARFHTAVNTINSSSLSLFGTSGVITDFGYINILYQDGLVFFFIFLILLTLTMKVCAENGMHIEIIIMTVIAIYTFAEAYTAAISINITLLFLSYVVYPDNRSKSFRSRQK